MTQRMSPEQFISAYVNKRRFNVEKHGSLRSTYDLSSRPEFYAGRGATQSDLNSNHLEMIYSGIEIEFGKEAAQRFVQFVYDLEVLSATAFLNAFFSFYSNDCTWERRPHRPSDDIDLGPEETRVAVGFAVIGHAFNNDRRDETEAIRQNFMFKHRNECEEWRPRKSIW